MSDEERYYATQDDSAIENHPAFERGYQAGLCDGLAEERDRISALETEIAELRARSDPDALRLWKEDMRAAECARIRHALVDSFHLAFGDGHETKHLLAVLDRIIPQDRKE